MKQYEAVIEALRRVGGYATLGVIYREALKIPDVEWRTKTPDATIRKIVQERPEIFRIRPGLWALEEMRKQIPSDILPVATDQNQTKEASDHTFYQGLLTEIGNLKGYRTYIPAQDKNRLYIKKQRLHEVAALTTCPRFTYEPILRRVQTIDVIWFRQSVSQTNILFPSAVYEVENSTDMQNAFLKFVELEDFHVEFFVVADNSRKELFQRKLNQRAFERIYHRVKFKSYEQVVKEHDIAFTSAQL